MKYIITVLTILWCVLPPIPPLPALGCSSMEPVCVCDDKGNCYWQFRCVRYGE